MTTSDRIGLNEFRSRINCGCFNSEEASATVSLVGLTTRLLKEAAWPVADSIVRDRLDPIRRANGPAIRTT